MFDVHFPEEAQKLETLFRTLNPERIKSIPFREAEFTPDNPVEGPDVPVNIYPLNISSWNLEHPEIDGNGQVLPVSFDLRANIKEREPENTGDAGDVFNCLLNLGGAIGLAFLDRHHVLDKFLRQGLDIAFHRN